MVFNKLWMFFIINFCSHVRKLFQTDRTSIVRHINNIYKVEELDREATCAKNYTSSKLKVKEGFRVIFHTSIWI